ncbi:ATP-binding protein [Bathymodiolus azoricus thioautotrophic gill symbiont]|uniref:ATP-binding protein n=1 Tax=Bathymodiolus azoricus thioautotrophic gill symbiont TaxID=235205 RepID=A0A1H6JGW7_9GAMM|nr:ATP-binding protein [Bathymodiolus azoricus thioautotrophic gill symbiont]
MKKFLKHYSPNPNELKNHKHLGWLGKHLHHSSLWNFNRKSISKAFAVGLFCAFIPVPFQMLLAAPSAVIFAANLPVSIALVWITNPITMPPIFYGCYKLGAWILDVSIEKDFVMSLEYVWQVFGTIRQPFLLGCLTLSIISSTFGYFAVQLTYRLKAYKRLRRS